MRLCGKRLGKVITNAIRAVGWGNHNAVRAADKTFFTLENKGRNRDLAIFHVHGMGEISTCIVGGDAIAERFRSDSRPGISTTARRDASPHHLSTAREMLAGRGAPPNRYNEPAYALCATAR